MPKRGSLKPMDEWEESIRSNATHYNVVMFRPGSSSRVYQSFELLDSAIVYAKDVLEENKLIRSAMIYAVNSDERFALVGTITRDRLEFKPVEPKYY